MISNAIDKVLNLKSRFCIVDNNRFYDCADIAKLVYENCKYLEEFPRGLCFFQMKSDAGSIAVFIAMLKLKFQPIVISPRLPANQLRDLLLSYPDIPVFRNNVFLDLSGYFCNPSITNPDLFIGLTTSGSTGKPKIIVAREAALGVGIKAISKAQGLHTVKSTCLLLPLYYSYPLVNQFFWALSSGKKLIITTGLAKAGETLKIMQKEKSDMVCMVGQQIRVLKSLGLTGKNFVLPSVKLVNFAGGAFPYDCLDSLRGLFPNAKFLNNYGCTEALPRVAIGSVSNNQNPTFVGPLISSLEAKILDRRNKSLLPLGKQERRNKYLFPNGKTGLIYIRGASTSCGLLDAGGNTIPHSPDKWLPTGDVGYFDISGNLYVLGRSDQIFNYGGERISLLSIENALRSCESIHDAVSAAVREENGEQWPLACITGRENPSKMELKKMLIKNLIKAAWPKKIIFFPKWPLLDNGKPDRKKIIHFAMTKKMETVWSLR